MFGLIPLTLVLALAACPLAHAMDMNAENNVSELEVPVMKDGKRFKEKLPIVSITADLISAREHARRQAVNNLPRVDTGPADYRICARDGVRGHAGLNDPVDKKYSPSRPATASCTTPTRALFRREEKPPTRQGRY